MATPDKSEKPRGGNPNWVKGGGSPNPAGRTSRKPLTSALIKALHSPWKAGRNETMLRMLIRRLAEVIAHGDDKDTIKAIELTWKYLEGAPMQTVEIDFQQALDDVAARTGAPRLWLMKRAEEITRRHMLQPGESRPEIPTGTDGRVRGVRL